MKINQRSPWFLVYVGVTSAVAVALITWLIDDEVNWWYTLFLAAAAVVGTILGNFLRARRG